MSEGGSTLETAESAITNIHFDVHGGTIPRDHRYALSLELARLLPWIAEDETIGIHPIQGAVTGVDELLLNHRTKLVIRADKARIAELQGLTGRSIQLGACTLTLGASKLRPITLHTPLYSHCVTTGSVDEDAFNADIMRELDQMHIDTRFICGKRQTIRIGERDIYGYSLMLHGIPIEHAIRVQETGLGLHRRLGCGIFIPHKSIKALE